MKKIVLSILMLCFSYVFFTAFKKPCEAPNTAFNVGEQATYKIAYSWGLMNIGAGEVDFTVKETTLNGQPVYNFHVWGSTYKSYDWFYKVRDRYDSYVDKETLKPIRFVRDTEEGGYVTYNDNHFDFGNNRATCYRKGNAHKNGKRDTMKISDCTFDVLSIVYYLRNLDASQYKKGDFIPVSVFLDEEVYELGVEFLGRETIKTEFGKVRCIKLSPKLVAGNVFSEDAKMNVWVTDDKNKVPVLIESPLVVGSVKAYLKEYTGSRYEMAAKVKK